MDFDAIVIGTGNAGQTAAGALVDAGWRVAIVEEDDVGGTCALRGCVPKKVLVAAAETLEAIARAADHRIDVGEAKLDWAGLIDRERSFVEGVPDEVARSLAKRGLEVVRGHARFTGRNEVDVGGRRLRAPKIVVATGSKPRPLPFEGADRLMTSDVLLRTRTLPSRAVFVGAGVIAFELAHVLVRAGSDVTMLEATPRPLGPFDEEAVDRLVAATRDAGIDIRTGVRVRRVEARDDRWSVVYEADGEELELVVDSAIHGAGRVAALDGLELESAGVKVDAGKPVLDAHLRSESNPHVLFAGDARGPGPQLSPVASYEGRLVAHNLLDEGSPRSPDYDCIPSCVFAIPALAMVGRTEKQARDDGVQVDVRESDMQSWISARTYAEREAYAKILVERETDRIVGAHLVGHGCTETIHAFALAMRHGLPASALAEMVYAYPTFHSDIRHLL